jgi:hypothetical protein
MTSDRGPVSRAPDTLLTILLRLVGGVELCAIPFIFFPLPWMDSVHDRLLGLSSLPDRPIVEYLTRSLSALYAVHGAVVMSISFNIERYRPLVRFLGYLHLLLGLTILGIDLAAGLPWWWVAMEGPGIVTGGLLVVLLERAGRAGAA